MLGVFSALSFVSDAISNTLYTILHLTALIWRFLEQYGWRILIGSAAAWHFIQRIWLEHERRQKIRSRLQAADPSRVAELNRRRDAVVEKLEVTHEQSIRDKRRRDEDIRLKRLEELERRMIGSGRRLGSD